MIKADNRSLRKKGLGSWFKATFYRAGKAWHQELEAVGHCVCSQPAEMNVMLSSFAPFLIYLYFIFYVLSFFACLCVCVKVLDPLELELQTVVSCHVGAGN